MKIRPVGAELFHADRRPDMKLIVAVRNFANALKTNSTTAVAIALFFFGEIDVQAVSKRLLYIDNLTTLLQRRFFLASNEILKLDRIAPGSTRNMVAKTEENHTKPACVFGEIRRVCLPCTVPLSYCSRLTGFITNATVS
jgi:hypothetical protein